MNKLRIGFLSGFFLLLLCPLVLQLSGWREKSASFENKGKVQAPKLDINNLDPFPGKYEEYYNDHFPARNSLIFSYNYFSARFLQKSPKPELVIIGKEGWLYLANNELNIYTGKLRFTDRDLKNCLKEIEYRSRKCRELGAEYRVVVIPSKYTVYPEYLPSYVVKYPGANATDQFITYMHTHSDLKILDLRPALIDAKKQSLLWIKGDNHWNSLGVFNGYRGVINWLTKDYPIRKALELSDVMLKDTLGPGGNIVEMLGMGSIWKNTHVKLTPIKPLPVSEAVKKNYPIPEKFTYGWEYEMPLKNADTLLPGLVVVRESFVNELFRGLLASHFGHTTYIWDAWEHRLNANVVRQEKPKLVLCMIIESQLDCFLNYQDCQPQLTDSATVSIH
jgi:alginate O-acetyltransferase complex protein AlgJ